MRKIYLLVILMLLLDRGVLFAQNSSTKVMAVCCGEIGGGGGGGGGCNIVAGSISISGATGDGCSGGNSTTLTLTGNSTGTITIQWYSSTDSTNFSPISGATGQSDTALNLTKTTYFAALVTSGACSAYTPRVTVTITLAPVWYKDADNDGYSDGTTLTQCVRPTGYKLVSELTATSGDCNDNDATVWQSVSLYIDKDGDGYDAGTATVCYGATVPAGYSVSTKGRDCNDNDASIHAPVLYYVDADGDGYGSSVTAQFCQSTSPAGYSAVGGDCNDNDPAISPAAVEVCGNGIDDNCNGQIDESPCYACLNATSLTTTNITSASAKLNWHAFANPVQWQVQYKSINKGSKWISLPLLTGNLRSVTISSLLSNQNYIWEIRAKCGKSWTENTDWVAFKTVAGTGSLSLSNMQKVNVESINARAGSITLHPNPTNGKFMVELNVAEKINATAGIQLIDMKGNIVHSENAVMYNGALQKTINVASSLAKEIYMVRVIVNNKTYKAPLIYEK